MIPVRKSGVVSRFKRPASLMASTTGPSSSVGGTANPAALERLADSLQKVTIKPKAKYIHF
jgi:hypothetical protein